MNLSLEIEKAISDAKHNYTALKSERERLQVRVTELEEELNAAKTRLEELNPGWLSDGLVGEAQRALRNAAFPIYDEEGLSARRIVKVDAKFITLRSDWSSDREVRFNRSNGWQERIKTGYRTIDIAKALQILEDSGYAPETLPDYK